MRSLYFLPAPDGNGKGSVSRLRLSSFAAIANCGYWSQAEAIRALTNRNDFLRKSRFGFSAKFLIFGEFMLRLIFSFCRAFTIRLQTRAWKRLLPDCRSSPLATMVSAKSWRTAFTDRSSIFRAMFRHCVTRSDSGPMNLDAL